MNGTIYRGTSLTKIKNGELTGGVTGSKATIYKGFMEPDEIDRDHTTERPEDLPWESRLKTKEVNVVGGFSDRLGVAQSFASGPLMPVYILEDRRVDAKSIRYDYGYLNGMEGVISHVNGPTTDGEIYVNGDLQGIATNPDENGDRRIKYWGEDVKTAVQAYEDEMEMIVFGRDKADIKKAVFDIVCYVINPQRSLAEFDGYATKYTAERTGDRNVSEMTDEEAIPILYEKAREVIPDHVPMRVAHIKRFLVHASWGHDRSDINMVYDGDRLVYGRDLQDETVLGDP